MKKSPLKELADLASFHKKQSKRNENEADIDNELINIDKNHDHNGEEQAPQSPLLRKVLREANETKQRKRKEAKLYNHNVIQALKPMTEDDNLRQNCMIANKSIDYFKEGSECFFVLCRQNKMRTFTDISINEIMQMIMRARFDVGKLLELFRMH
jgi:hypothetical protein